MGMWNIESGIAAAAAAAAVRGVPFSAVQLQELERQTIVYNYMRASIPIPSELLVPTTKSVPKSNRKPFFDLQY